MRLAVDHGRKELSNVVKKAMTLNEPNKKLVYHIFPELAMYKLQITIHVILKMNTDCFNKNDSVTVREV